MKLLPILLSAVLVGATISSCHKDTSAPVKKTGFDGYRSWHRYTVFDRTTTLTVGSSVTTHDTDTLADQGFALTVISESRIKYHDRFATLQSATDTLKVYHYEDFLSETDSDKINIYYYPATDRIIAEYSTIYNNYDTSKREHSVRMERAVTF